jgi:hypothetical protein
MNQPMKLLKVKKSSKPEKKYMATFLYPNGKQKTIHFGASGYNDYTSFPDDVRDLKKLSYLNRHESRENWNQPDTPGALSRWILWNKTSLLASIADFKRRFNL